MKRDVRTVQNASIGWGLEPAMHDDHDYLVSTGHLANPEKDYANFRATGAHIVRSGLRTRYVNPAKSFFDFEDAIRQARAAQRNDIFVYWDLSHYDYPRWVSDPWGESMIEAFVDLGIAFVRRLSLEGIEDVGICVWNEMLLWASWMAGNKGTMTLEDSVQAGSDLRERWKSLGIRTTFAVMRAVHAQYPKVKFLIAEPCHRDEILDFLRDMKAADPEEMKKLSIGLNAYPTTHPPFSFDPVGYFVPIVEEIRKEFPQNDIIFSETSSVGNWGLPERIEWFKAMRDVQRLSRVDTMIWYPALDYGAWHDESIVVEHGAWSQNSERTAFAPLVEAVSRANGVRVFPLETDAADTAAAVEESDAVHAEH